MTSKTAVSIALAKLAQRKNADVSPAVIDAYVEDLLDLPLTSVIAACVSLGRETTFGFPQCGTIREKVNAELYGDVEGRALQAWADVLRACRSGGMYRDVAFADPATGQALQVAVGTWPRMCNLTLDSFEFSKVRETFLATYERLASAPRDNAPVVLRGLGDIRKVYAVSRSDRFQSDGHILPAATEREYLPESRTQAVDMKARILKVVADRAKVTP